MDLYWVIDDFKAHFYKHPIYRWFSHHTWLLGGEICEFVESLLQLQVFARILYYSTTQRKVQQKYEGSWSLTLVKWNISYEGSITNRNVNISYIFYFLVAVQSGWNRWPTPQWCEEKREWHTLVASRRECADKALAITTLPETLPFLGWFIHVYTIHSPRGCCIICIYPMVYTIRFSGRIGDGIIIITIIIIIIIIIMMIRWWWWWRRRRRRRRRWWWFLLLLLSSFFFFFLLLLLLPLGLQRHFCFGCFDGPPICTVTVQSGFTDLLVLRQYQ